MGDAAGWPLPGIWERRNFTAYLSFQIIYRFSRLLWLAGKVSGLLSRAPH
ncbi:protein of unknown function [Hyphomicrobium sp. 1Nfss2.1]